nr:unnamed protein product [Digitaria exilis]CAB3505111.1 unnamed protein product [Digitaria exilis]
MSHPSSTLSHGPFPPEETTIPAADTAVATASMITCASRTILNPFTPPRLYTSSAAGRYSANSSAAPSVAATPTITAGDGEVVAEGEEEGGEGEEDDGVDVGEGERDAHERGGEGEREGKLHGEEEGGGGDGQVGGAARVEEVVEAHHEAEEDAAEDETWGEAGEELGRRRTGEEDDDEEEGREAGGLDQRGEPPVRAAVGEVETGEEARGQRADEEGSVGDGQQQRAAHGAVAEHRRGAAEVMEVWWWLQVVVGQQAGAAAAWWRP